MLNYIGVRCPVCGKKFTESDDIVVCPVCGAPHHRGCYAKNNQCVFVSEHLSGTEWQNPLGQAPPEEPQSDAVKACVRCGASCPEGSIFCQVCGQPLSPPGERQWSFPGGFGMQADTVSMVYGGLSPEDTISGETARDLAAYVGAGSSYYLPRFQLISESGRSFLPNLAAFFFNFFYFFYRKMYWVGGALLVLWLVSTIPACFIIWEYTMPVTLRDWGYVAEISINQDAVNHYAWLNNISRSVYMGITLIASFTANRLYYGKALTEVQAIRAGAQRVGRTDYTPELARVGGCSKLAAAVAAVFVTVLYFSAVGAMMTAYLGG